MQGVDLPATPAEGQGHFAADSAGGAEYQGSLLCHGTGRFCAVGEEQDAGSAGKTKLTQSVDQI
jgi:hypothetical protein